MQVTELHDLTQWVNDHIHDPNLLGHFDALISIIDANSKKGNGQPFQSFEDEKNNLVRELRHISTSNLTNLQIQALANLSILDNIGPSGANLVEQALSNTLDIAHALNQIQNMRQNVASGNEKSQAIRKAFAPLNLPSEPVLDEDSILTRLTFQEDAHIEDIDELNTWSQNWLDISRGFSISCGKTPQDVKVIGASKGSFIVDLAILVIVAKPLVSAIESITRSMVNFQDFRLKGLEIRQMKDRDPRAADALEQSAQTFDDLAEDFRQNTIEEITENLANSIEEFDQANYPALKRAVRQLTNFLYMGGDVDCVVEEEPQDDTENDSDLTTSVDEISQDFTRIRELKRKITHLEYMPPPLDEEEGEF